MNLRDAVSIGMFVLALGGIVAQVAISLALTKRDRRDFEDLRSDHDALKESVAGMREDIAEMRGAAKAKAKP